MFTGYEQYEGRSIGRLSHFLAYYLNGTHYRHAETQIGDGKIWWNKDVILNYEFQVVDFIKDGTTLTRMEVPVFSPTLALTKVDAAEIKKNQFFYRPYVDCHYIKNGLEYAVQEVRKCLTFDDGLFLIWLRDVHNSDWSRPVGIPKIERKVLAAINTAYHGRVAATMIWKHLCMCAVYGVTNDL